MSPAAELGDGLRGQVSPEQFAAYVLRTKNDVGLDAMARAATGGLIEYDELIRTVLRGNFQGIQNHLNPPWVRQLARVIGLLDPNCTRAALALFRHIASGSSDEFETKTANVYAQMLLRQGDLDDLEAVLPDLPLSPSIRWALRCDRVNPFSSPRGDLTEWLATVNEVLTPAGLEPITLRSNDAITPFERLSSTAPQISDDQELVTVVMPAFQPDSAIVTAVRSILAQTWRNLELLVVDDASPPEYEGLFQRIATMDPRVRVIRQPVNGGTYAARNRGLAEARGTFVTFQDADDWSHPRRIERQVEPLAADGSLLATRSRSVRAYANLMLTYPGYLPGRVNASSLLFRREPVLKTLGEFDSVRKSADIEFPERLQAAIPNSLLDIDGPPMAFVQLREGSLSRADATPEWIHWSRIAYRNSYRHWHRDIRAGRSPAFRTSRHLRPFPVPDPSWERTRAQHIDAAFDVVVLNDWRPSRPEIPRQINDLVLLRESGYRVAAAHLEVPFPLAEQRTALAPELQRLINMATIPLIHITQPALVRNLLIAHSDIAALLPSSIALQADNVQIDIATRGGAHDTERLPLRSADGRVQEVLGKSPKWLTRDSLVAQRLVREVKEPRISRAHPPVAVAPPSLAISRNSPGVRPVVGMQPLEELLGAAADTKLLRLAFPDSDELDVRLRGNVRQLRQMLALRPLPPNWVAYRRSELTTRQFLAQLDAFVFPFVCTQRLPVRQAIIEAMAAGCLVVLHPQMESEYGDAAVYAEPADCTRVVAEFHASRSAMELQRSKSTEYARWQFSSFQSAFSEVFESA